MLTGCSTQHILQMLKDPQGIEYDARVNPHPFSQASTPAADDRVMEGPLKGPVQKSTLALETILQQAKQFA